MKFKHCAATVKVRYSNSKLAPEQEILNKLSIFALGEPGVFLNAELVTVPEAEIGHAQAQDIGRRALWQAGVFKAELGVNDPLTHLEQYLQTGEAALDSIDEDLITDIAERKLKPTFINSVVFEQAGDDFISRENRFSMRSMTAITESKFANGNLADVEQYKRAKIEAAEVERLNTWFDSARAQDVFVTESMPLGKERYAIVRIYEKTGAEGLNEHVITLHNSTLGLFNELRSRFGVNDQDSRTALELLGNSYELSPGEPDFAGVYVATYDEILSEQASGKFNFGLPAGDKPKENDILSIRRQTALRSVYLNTIRALGQSGGRVTDGIARLNRQLGGQYELFLDTPISKAIAGELLDRSLQSVVATFNRASSEQLAALEISGVSDALTSAGHYGGEARAEGVRYDGACPSGVSPAQSEAAVLAQAHKFNKDPSRCGTCPKCRKQYYVEAKVYKAGILECNNCHAAIRFGGGAVSRVELDKLRSEERTGRIGFLDSIVLSIKKAGLETKIDKLHSRAEHQELSALDRRRQERLLVEYTSQLEQLEYLTG